MVVRLVSSLGLLAVGLLACAAPAPPPPASPPTVSPPAPATPPPLPDAGTATEAPPLPPVASSAPVPDKPPEAAPDEKPSRPPIELLTSPETAFLINYTGSAPVETARGACSKKSGTDDEAIAKCMADARAAFRPDVIRFKKDGSHWSCVIYKRDGSRLDEVYSARVDLSEDSPNSVKLKFTGAEKGARPLLKSKRELVLQVPNDYSFVLTDPEYGRLVYEAKVGLVGN